MLGVVRHCNANVGYVGFGGSNAAVIIEAAPAMSRASNKPSNGIEQTNNTGFTNGNGPVNGNGVVAHDHPSHDSVQRLFVLSAKTETSLISYLPSFREYLDTTPDSGNFALDLSFTLGQRRTHHPYRVAVAANSLYNLKEQLSKCKIRKAGDLAIAYAFTGQGAQ